MLWTNLNGKKIGIWGMGREGVAAKKAIQKHVQKADLIEISEENADLAQGCDVLIKSPGVSLYRPEIQKAKDKGVVITSGTNLFFTNKNPNVKVIAVTGTKGKSTTSALLAHVLKGLGFTVNLGGNIGKPLIDFVDDVSDFVVAELSSYQCADLKARPDIGVLTNLFPEHLQWHQSHENYYRDKWRLIEQSKQAVLNAKDEKTQEFKAPENTTWFNDMRGVHIQNEMFYAGQEALFEIRKLPLKGVHNAENACAVLSVLKLLGLDLKQAEFDSFKALPHRLEILGERGGITYVDDSISTTPETALAALKALDNNNPITLIAGGFDRGQVYDKLAQYLAEYKDRLRLVTLPDTGKRLAHLAQQMGVQTSPTSDMATAVSVAEHITPRGGIILLSPAAPSYNLYPNFEARGDDFKHCAGF